MGDTCDSHAEKVSWEPPERLHQRNADRLFQHFGRTACVSPSESVGRVREKG